MGAFSYHLLNEMTDEEIRRQDERDRQHREMMRPMMERSRAELIRGGMSPSLAEAYFPY